jgi:hypothetical protein
MIPGLTAKGWMPLPIAARVLSPPFDERLVKSN